MKEENHGIEFSQLFSKFLQFLVIYRYKGTIT